MILVVNSLRFRCRVLRMSVLWSQIDLTSFKGRMMSVTLPVVGLMQSQVLMWS